MLDPFAVGFLSQKKISCFCLTTLVVLQSVWKVKTWRMPHRIDISCGISLFCLTSKGNKCILDGACCDDTHCPLHLPNTAAFFPWSCREKIDSGRFGWKYEENELFVLEAGDTFKGLTSLHAHIRLQWEHLPNERASLNSRGTIALI